jgi:aminoglycoside phosphotransferase (APT) family kinase protein
MPGMDPLTSGLLPLTGGYGNETFLAEVGDERTVVRIYAERGARRGEKAPEVDAAVLRLVRGLLPVPEVLEVRRAHPQADAPGLLVTSFLPGERLDLLLAEADEALRHTVGTNLGTILARLAQMPTLRAGLFADGELRLADLPEGLDDLADWVDRHVDDSALASWTVPDREALREVAAVAQDRLDTVGRSCLVHSDFNPKNLLVDPATGTVTGLLDWEFAHSGNPFTDLGNLLRFHRDPAFADSVLTTYSSALDLDPVDALDLARAADLFALVELAGRRGQNPVTQQAHDLLLAIARQRDLHAGLPG